MGWAWANFHGDMVGADGHVGRHPRGQVSASEDGPQVYMWTRRLRMMVSEGINMKIMNVYLRARTSIMACMNGWDTNGDPAKGVCRGRACRNR